MTLRLLLPAQRLLLLQLLNLDDRRLLSLWLLLLARSLLNLRPRIALWLLSLQS